MLGRLEQGIQEQLTFTLPHRAEVSLGSPLLQHGYAEGLGVSVEHPKQLTLRGRRAGL